MARRAQATPPVDNVAPGRAAIVDVATRSVAHFTGYRMGQEWVRRSSTPATDSRVARVFLTAVDDRRVADGHLATFLSAWRLAEALARRGSTP